MTATRNIRMLTRYTAWANSRLYSALSELPVALLLEARPGRPNGMNGILSHSYAVDLIWKAHFEGKGHGLSSRNFEVIPSFDELRLAQRQVDEWYIAYADEQGEESLEQVMSFKFVDGGSGSMSRGDMLLHIVNHKTYHRGYVADMLYESGNRPPTMDLPVFLRDEPPDL
ncbi:DinB family protein [Zobellella iuensis]|uniref:DinB family protein n=1 Tax=Zobellella iuensis TaxID=2803811 RepID=A0ABS1QS38_9GAMM|nr:DinB family protein [Zobellella iuensis]MBL1377407.1 DinB family protein [Zobellella iuensis]